MCLGCYKIMKREKWGRFYNLLVRWCRVFGHKWLDVSEDFEGVELCTRCGITN